MQEGFWDDSEKAQKIMIEINDTRDTIEDYRQMEGSMSSITEIMDLLSV